MKCMGDFGKQGRPTQIMYEDQMGFSFKSFVSSVTNAVSDAANIAKKALSPVQSALGKDVVKVLKAPVKVASFSFNAIKKPIESTVKNVVQTAAALAAGGKATGEEEGEVTEEVVQYVDENGNPISEADLAQYNLNSSGQATPNYSVPLANGKSNTGKYVAYGVSSAVVAGLAYYYFTRDNK